MKVLPTFRSDKAVAIDAPGFGAYLQKLGNVSGVAITGFAALCKALESRIDSFDKLGCRAAEHVENAIFAPAHWKPM